jgi:signal transduction histidine kinase
MKLLHSVFPSGISLETFIFAIIGNICWIAIYVLLVKNARKNQFIEMPFFLVVGNMVWEGLYGFVLPVESSLSPVLQWGTKGWFILDCFIFAFALKYAKNSISTPLVLDHIKIISLALILLWGTMVYAIAYDGGPVVGMNAQHVMDKGFIREGKSAFLLGIMISVTYVFEYLRLYDKQVFLPSVAWLKLIGNAAATIAIAFYRPFNEFLVVLGVLTFIADVVYIVLRFRMPNKPPTVPLNQKDYAFPPNPKFDALWEKNPEYLEIKGLRLRKLRLPHWKKDTRFYSVEYIVLEGVIANVIHNGDLTKETIRDSMDLGDKICFHEMGWGTTNNDTTFAISDVRKLRSIDSDARRFSSSRYLQQKYTVVQYLVLTKVKGNLVVLALKLTRFILPKKTQAQAVFSTFEDAVVAMLDAHFSRSKKNTVNVEESLMEILPQGDSYHETRLRQLFTILSKIESHELENVPIPEVPDDDIYADVFQALVMVMDDKKMQLEKAHHYTQELERQANQIQLANNELSQQNHELAALNTEKNELMGIIAHDLKNPIGAVRGYAELIENQTITGDEALAVSGQIVQVSERMLGLVKNLLDLNRFELGSVQLNMVSFDISPVVEAAIDQYNAPATAKQITLHYQAEVPENIASADEQALMQVLDNLISNAVKYSPYGKQVFIRILRNEGFVRVEVQDEGEGISLDDMKKLFGKFQRLSAMPTGNEHSTGLGLSIVKKMVEAMNGRVWCESEFGKGATFIVELLSA